MILFPQGDPFYIFAEGSWGGDIEVFRQVEGRWEQVATLGTATGGSLAPDAVVGNDGKIHVVWEEWENLPEGNWEIYYDVISP